MTPQTISLTIGDDTMSAYFAPSNSLGKRPGIVLLHEIFGINASIRASADAFAATGFDVLVPDLFWRQEPGVQLDPASADDRARAMELMQGFDDEQGVADMTVAVERLRDLGDASGGVAAIGYCLGGRLAYDLAVARFVDAAVSYYGVGIQARLDQMGRVAVPLLLHIAEKDALCDQAAQAAIKTEAGKNANIAVVDYPGVGHAFARKNSAGFDAVMAPRADANTLQFLRDKFG